MDKKKLYITIGAAVAVIAVVLAILFMVKEDGKTTDKKASNAAEGIASEAPTQEGEEIDASGSEAPASTAAAAATAAPSQGESATTNTGDKINPNATITTTKMPDGTTHTIYSDVQENQSGLTLKDHPENDDVNFSDLFPESSKAPSQDSAQGGSQSSSDSQSEDSGWGDLQ